MIPFQKELRHPTFVTDKELAYAAQKGKIDLDQLQKQKLRSIMQLLLWKLFALSITG